MCREPFLLIDKVDKGYYIILLNFFDFLPYLVDIQ
nr:MAG TPA: hypothetical protein [Bacteriophage sp.]